MHIGIDVGGTNTGIGIVDDKGGLLGQTIFATNKDRDFESLCNDIILRIKELFNEKSLDISSAESLGIGLPGIVDSNNGIFIFAPNMSVSNFPIKEFFQKELNIPTYIENDANCAALAEAVFGSTKDYYSSITITIGTGIGGGIIVDKKILKGNNNCAGEVGHMVVNINGEKCGCGRKGCWEQYASSSALRRIATNAAKVNPNSVINKLCGWDYERLGGKIIFEALSQGDMVAKKVIDQYIQNLGEGIVNLINIFDPEVIAIGGGISKQGDRLIRPISEIVKNSCICKINRVPAITTAMFGREAGIIGASLLKRYL